MATTNGMVYDEGYEDGYNGRTSNDAYKGDKFYAEGYDAGQCDFPTLEEVIGADYQMESNAPFGY